VVTEVLPLDIMLPAPGQGALAIQCRDDADTHALLAPINHAESAAATIAERAFLQGLGGGCSAPVGAYGWFRGSRLHLHGRWLAPDGGTQIDVESVTDVGQSSEQAREAGRALAEQALAQGAGATA
jgi:hydroxymethylbilane synthase